MKKKKNGVTLSVYIPIQLDTQVREWAEANNRRLSNAVVVLLSDALKGEGR